MPEHERRVLALEEEGVERAGTIAAPDSLGRQDHGVAALAPSFLAREVPADLRDPGVEVPVDRSVEGRVEERLLDLGGVEHLGWVFSLNFG